MDEALLSSHELNFRCINRTVRAFCFPKVGYEIVLPGVLVLHLSQMEKSDNPPTPKNFPDHKDLVITCIYAKFTHNSLVASTKSEVRF